MFVTDDEHELNAIICELLGDLEEDDPMDLDEKEDSLEAFELLFPDEISEMAAMGITPTGEHAGLYHSMVEVLENGRQYRARIPEHPHPSTPELRKKWRAYHDEIEIVANDWVEKGNDGLPLASQLPPFPPELLNMTCGAKTRAGTPCKRRDLHRNGRCRMHGGPSTGPKSNRRR